MKQKVILILFFFIVILHSVEITFGPRIDRGMIENNEIDEASGLAISGYDGNVLWVHNDSGGDTAIYAMNNLGQHLGKYYLEGITFRDVEDIASGNGPVNGEKYLYIGDVGDNMGNYSTKYIYRILEPEVSASQAPEEETIPASDIELIEFSYEDGSLFDCETLFVDNLSNDIWLVTKRNPSNPYSGTTDIVYKLEYPQSTNSINTASQIAELSVMAYQDYGITGGDLSSSGLELLLRTYDGVYYWQREIDEAVSAMFDNPPQSVNYEMQPQGEAICWNFDDDAYYSCGEEYQSYPAHLSYYARLSSFIQISQLPTELYKSNEQIEIIWQPEGLYNQLYYSSSGGGEILENYTASGIWGENILLTSPGQLGLSVGVYQGILHNPEYNYLSIEFPLIVESEVAPQMTNPPNGSTINNPLPVFEWQVNPGVPYYLIAVSDTPFIIEHDENGDAIITGIETVWQAITYETSLMYGMPDPSGYFNITSPPLISGQEYNWIVANNYGNDPLFTSKVAGNPHSFTFMADYTLDSVELLTPSEGELLFEENINFSWTFSENAMYYQIQVFEIRQEGSNVGNYLIWDQTTTNTQIEMDAEAILIAADYTWKVYATSIDEISSVSASGHFSYDIPVGTLQLHVRDNYGSPVAYATAELDPIDGSSDNFPLAVNESGNESKTVPVGEYIIEVSKNGYEQSDSTFAILDNEETELSIELVYSPSFFYGRITDQSGNNLSNVKVIAENEEGEEREVNSINGSYVLAVTSGEWTIKAEKKSWICLNEISIEIEPGENLELSDISMQSSNKDIQGFVRNHTGTPLMFCHIEASFNGTILRSISNANGFYEFTGVNLGNYHITGVKPGYSVSSEVTLSINTGSPPVTLAEDLILYPSAMINGTARNGLVGLKDVNITAVPEMGYPVETTSDEYGNYQLNLQSGTYYLGAYREHYTNQTTYQVSLSVGETLDNLDFVLLPNDAYIRGSVFSEGSGLAGVQVSAGENHILTDHNGEYELTVYPGTYLIEAYKNGYTTDHDYTLSLSPDQIVENIDFELYPNASIINGMIHHQGMTIAQADVFAEKQTGYNNFLHTESNSAGLYSFSLLHGSYKLWAEKTNFACLPEDTVFVEVAPGEILENINIQLYPIEAYITGRIIDEQNLGVNEATIEITGDNAYYTTMSNSQGNFSVVVEPGYSYQLFAYKYGYNSNSAETDILEIGEETNLDIVLVRMPSTISGRTFDQDGIALEGVSINCDGNESYSTVSGVNGNWLLSIFAGEYLLTAAKPGYFEETQMITMTPGSQIDSLNFYLQENFAILEGLVISSNTVEPLSGVLVTANYSGGGGGTGYTDNQGFYRLENLLPGVYQSVIYTHSGHYSHVEPNILLPGSYTTNLNVVMEPYESAIRSTVTYQGSGMSGVTVAAENLNNGDILYDVTNEQGISTIYDLSSLIPHEVSVSFPNYTAESIVVYPVPGEMLELDFELIRIDGMIYGGVFDQVSNPIEDVTVIATSPDGYQGSYTTSSDGMYQIEGLASNRQYSVNALASGYSLEEELEVYLSEEPLELNIFLYEHNFQATGCLIDQTGIPLEGIQVNCQSEQSWAQTQSGATGSITLESLAPFSTYNFWTTAYENGYENVNWIEYLGSQNLDLGEITITVHISIIRGLITDSNTGYPLSDVFVTAYNHDTGLSSGAISQPDGSYRIRYLYSGNYSLSAVKDSYASVEIESLNLAHREEMLLDLEMEYNEPLLISGQVTDTDYRPQQNVPVKRITADSTITVYTDQTGEFAFPGSMPFTSTILTTDLDPHDFDNNWIEFSTGSEDTTDIALIIDIHDAGVSGEVSCEGFPLSNVVVSFASMDSSWSQITSGDGLFEFSHLYEDWYFLSCYRPGYIIVSEEVQVNDHENIVRNIALDQIEGTISGIVHSSSEPALANALVQARSQNQTVMIDTTNNGGAFQLVDLLSNQNYEIRVSKTGFTEYTHSDSVNIDSDPLDIELEPVPNSLSGTVYYQGTAISDATVIIRDQNLLLQEVHTNQFGDYCFTNINGYYDVWAVYDSDYTSISEGITIVPGAARRYYPELIEAASISGTTLYQNQLKPGVSVTATNTASGRWAIDITEEDGLFELTGLPAGHYHITYYCEGYSFLDPVEDITLAYGEDIMLQPLNMSFMQNSISGVVQKINTRIGISEAEVTLYDSLHILLEDYITEADGTFLFSPLPDGNYYIAARHPAYEEPEDICIELSGGSSNPPTADFNLVPRELSIFGYVQTDDHLPISNAVIEIEKNEFGKASKLRAKSRPYDKRSYSDTTDTQGFYQISVDTTGFWNINVYKANFYPAEPVTVELTWDDNYFQQDFYLQPIELFADLQGSVKIWDDSWVPPDEFSIRLYSSAGIDSLLQYSAPDTLWKFENLNIPDNFSIDLIAKYNDQYFFERREDIMISQPQAWTENFTFTYIPESYSWYGNIHIFDENLIPLPDAELSLLSNLGENYQAQTNQYGYYHFGILPEADYKLEISAGYDNEVFYYESPWQHINSNFEYDHTFDFYLAELGISIGQSATQPLPDTQIDITGIDPLIHLVTNHLGYCTTSAVLHTGSYQINITPPQNSDHLFLKPQIQNILIDTLGFHNFQKILPLHLTKSNYGEDYNFDESIPVYLHLSSQFNGNATLYYQFQENPIEELVMTKQEAYFYQTIPPQNDSGSLQFWCSAADTTFTNYFTSSNSPVQIQISAAGIPTASLSSILPTNPVLPYGSSVEMQLTIMDALGNKLNQEILEEAEVIWYLSNNDMGTITESEFSPYITQFTAAELDINEISGKVFAELDYLDFHLKLSQNITTGSFRIAELQITGPHEVANTDSANYSIQIYSQNGRPLNLSWEYQANKPQFSDFIVDNGILKFYPTDDFLGENSILISAYDSIADSFFYNQADINIFLLVTAQTQAGAFTTDLGCDLITYDEMLNNTKSSARIYLNAKEVSPYQEVAVEYESVSGIFVPNSNLSESAFNILPGLSFDPLGNVDVARWDNYALKWQVLQENSSQLPHINLFADHYCALKNSDALGVYDLKLLPNPFSPYDLIGSNRGLQIQFRISSSHSRYVNLTARIYTMNGQLVRELAYNLPMLKGDYLAGELNTLFWDGYTDENKMARNGRYLLHLIAEDSENKKELIKSIVLVK